MLCTVLTLSALVALGHTKAIVTNNCRKDIYLWSVPERPDLANNLSISPGKRYEEPWHSGTAVTPGIAIKVSTEGNGVYTGKSEIDFQYSIDPFDSSKIWISLGKIRGNDFDTATLNTCQGVLKVADSFTKECSSTDEIELVLCGSERTVPARDSTSPRVISNCIGLLSERDDALHPRLCSGRVVGPKRMPMALDEHEDLYLAEQHATLPLKTVMRLEAAKHAPAPDGHNITMHNIAMHNITIHNITMHNITMCIEPYYETFSRLWHLDYPTVKAVFNNYLFQDRVWTSDEELCSQPSKVIEPATNSLKACVKQFCDGTPWIWLQGKCTDVEDALGTLSQAAGYRVDWTSDDEVCKEPWTGDYAVGNNTKDTLEPIGNNTQDTMEPRALESDRKRLCIWSAYRELERFPRDWPSRRSIKEWLNSEAYGLFQDIWWTSDDEQCLNGNNSIPAPRYGAKIKPCVEHVCHTGECSDVEDALDRISEQAGKLVDWTTDTDDCEAWPYKHARATPGRSVRRWIPAPIDNTVTAHRLNDVRNVCIITANEKLGKYFGADETEELVKRIFPKTHWTSNLDDCSPKAISESQDYHHKLIDKKQHKKKRCLQSLTPLIHSNIIETTSNGTQLWVLPCEGKACKRLKKDLNKLSNDVGEHWTWTDDEGSCDACKDFLGTKTLVKLQEYWGEGWLKTLKEIFPGVPLIDADTSCDEEEELEPLKKWYNDHHRELGARCVKPYCVPYEADCSDVEDQLEAYSKKIGQIYDWTTDDDVCPEDPALPLKTSNLIESFDSYENLDINRGYGKVVRSSQQEIPEAPPSSMAKRDWPCTDISDCFADECVVPRGIAPRKECRRLKRVFAETIAAVAGFPINFRTACDGSTTWVMLYSEGISSEVQQRLGKLINGTLGMHSWFTGSDEAFGVCDPNSAGAAEAHLPEVQSRSPKTLCLKVYCSPLIPGVDCGKLEQDVTGPFGTFDVTVSCSVKTCTDNPILYRQRIHTTDGRQLMCMKDYCSLAEGDCTQTFPGIRNYYKRRFHVDIEPTLNEWSCGPEGEVLSKRNWDDFICNTLPSDDESS
ncbi:hypothetical protein BU23DRAFT_550856 [Bimuria novae-zelandiae CBS 107.79]|uniref:Cyanovirin-N domain-containing protein n=1 Tax=Bimuria novae-zelandiae CBS 107.79 TaxID=1447943 RepID=A0A6A5VM63_9PLEO|nr:hypothetical protein BU23DRAFT_550856 [Bimuria novae-zelandiae CBS 107.79]